MINAVLVGEECRQMVYDPWAFEEDSFQLDLVEYVPFDEKHTGE